MSRRDGGKAHAAATQIGPQNMATLDELVREVFQRVGPRVLQWRVAWGIEPLIGLVVLHTCVVTAREMRLGDLAEELKAHDTELARIKQERDDWRRAAEAEARGGKARADMLSRVKAVLAQFRGLADGSGSNRVNFPHDMAYAASVLDEALRGDDV